MLSWTRRAASLVLALLLGRLSLLLLLLDLDLLLVGFELPVKIAASSRVRLIHISASSEMWTRIRQGMTDFPALGFSAFFGTDLLPLAPAAPVCPAAPFGAALLLLLLLLLLCCPAFWSSSSSSLPAGSSSSPELELSSSSPCAHNARNAKQNWHAAETYHKSCAHLLLV
jgi:hypothetical protein